MNKNILYFIKQRSSCILNSGAGKPDKKPAHKKAVISDSCTTLAKEKL